MILATHGVAGALLAQTAASGPLAALVIGFLSHFVLDALPHWDYKLRSEVVTPGQPLARDLEWGPAFRRDLLKIGLDFLVGVALVWGLSRFSAFDPRLLWFGLAGGVAPDALQFAYFKLRWPPLRTLQKFHLSVHTTRRLVGQPVLGLGLQVSFLVILWLVLV